MTTTRLYRRHQLSACSRYSVLNIGNYNEQRIVEISEVWIENKTKQPPSYLKAQ